MGVARRLRVGMLAGLVGLGSAGCGAGAYLLPPHLGGTVPARSYQQAVEARYQAVETSLQEAATSEELAIAHDPRWAPAYARLATLFLALGEPREAVQTARLAARVSPRKAVYWIDWGEMAVAAGDGSEARRAFRGALHVNPAAWQAWDGLALEDVAHGRYLEATVDIRRALAIAGPQGETYEAFGRLAESQRNLVAARRYFLDAAQTDPGWWRPHYDLARLDLQARRPGRAGAQLRAALSDDPGSAEAWLLLQRLPTAMKAWARQAASKRPRR